MKKTIGLVLILLMPVLAVIFAVDSAKPPQDKLEKLKEKMAKKHIKSVDHSKFPQLQKKFARPQDVTLECIACHTERHKEIMQTPHWRWLSDEYVEGKGIVSIGKRNIINNHCIAIGGSEGSCNRCHIGYGYGDKNFDFTKAENVDCLACHDNSGVYQKEKEAAGMPKASVDLSMAAQHVGKPMMENCGYCHFNGGGGNNAKHGDLEEALYETTRMVDVHMGKDGANMECVDCHTAENHKMEGKLYTVSSMNKDRMSCEKCHTEAPHEDDMLNEHTLKVACQTCHIPEYAKVNATKTHWDWSKAGKMRNGEPYTEHDKDGNETYLSIKGEIKWEKNLKPEYQWFNGTASHYMQGDTASVFPIVLNPFHGDYSDINAKITPVKVMRSKQPYDPVLKKVLTPKLWDAEKGKGAYWKDFNWDIAIAKGMEYQGQPWSGKYSFANTESNWILNHMVAPKEQSVKCEECHTRSNSRLEAIKDVYIPGRDYSSLVDTMGVIFMGLTFAGVASHGAIRIISRKRATKHEEKA